MRMVLLGLHIAISFLCLTVCRGGRAEQRQCPSQGWVLAGESTCLLFVDNMQLTAGQANDWCNSVGASLLRFANYDSVGYFSEAATVRGKDGWWSDLTDLHQPGTWTWGGTERVTPGALAWATEPTDNHHVENCVSIDSGGLLSDEDCNRRLGYICSYTPTTDGSCAGQFRAAGGQCYFTSFLDDPTEIVSWAAAGNSCLAQSPQDGVSPVLASFTTAVQLQGLQRAMGEVHAAGKRWVGLNDRATEREWVWSDGTRVTDTSFFQTQWKTYPAHGGGHSCGLVHSNGGMEEAYCGEKHYFVCQITLSPEYFLLQNGLGCPAPWIRGGNKCYFFNPRQLLSRKHARSLCSGMNGVLLKIDNMDERDWVMQQTVSRHMFNTWTGLRRVTDGASTWVWDDGSRADTSLYQWNKQPSASGYWAKHCAFINTRGVYNEASCFTPLSFICEMDTEDVPCPSRWLSDESNDRTTCYYVSSNETDGVASWQEAVNQCRQLAGLPDAHLVAITSQSEMDYMLSLMTTHPYAGYWTDLTDTAVHGVWSFSQQYEGTPPPIPWDQEPNNAGGDENCAVIYTDGKYSDVDCSRSAHVLCERPAAGLTSKASATRQTTGGFGPKISSLLLMALLVCFPRDLYASC